MICDISKQFYIFIITNIIFNKKYYFCLRIMGNYKPNQLSRAVAK